MEAAERKAALEALVIADKVLPGDEWTIRVAAAYVAGHYEHFNTDGFARLAENLRDKARMVASHKGCTSNDMLFAAMTLMSL